MLKSTPKSLKQRNQPQLVIFAVANVIAVMALIVGPGNLAQWIESIKQGDWALVLRLVALPAVGSLTVGLVNWTIPKAWKELLIFWHRGARSLPSSESFTKVAPSDARIDMSNLATRLGDLPSDYGKQSALWYATYRKHRAEASVEDANSAYLLYREMCGLVPVVFVGMLVLNVWQSSDLRTWLLTVVALAIEFGMVVSASRNAGYRLVANVLALESASPVKTSKSEQEPNQSPVAATKPRATKPRKTKEAGS